MNTSIENMSLHANWLLKHELKATPLAIPDDLARIEGEYKGRKIVMTSRAWQTGLYKLIRYTGLEAAGKLSTFNLVLYPHSCFDAPIFASDWVVNEQQLRIAVIDAMPLFPEDEAYLKKWVEPFKEYHQRSLSLAPAFDRKLSWSTKYLGPSACLATKVPSTELAPLVSLWKSYLGLYLYLTANMPQVDEARQRQVEQWHRKYNQEHKAVENKRNPYMVYFGEEIGRRYNEEFLFTNQLSLGTK